MEPSHWWHLMFVLVFLFGSMGSKSVSLEKPWGKCFLEFATAFVSFAIWVVVYLLPLLKM